MINVEATNKMSKTVKLLLGDQLNINHSWFQNPDDSVTYVLMEIRTETDYAWKVSIKDIKKINYNLDILDNSFIEGDNNTSIQKIESRNIDIMKTK